MTSPRIITDVISLVCLCVCVRVCVDIEQALKLGLHRKFSDHLSLVREAMKIFLRSSVLLMVLVRDITFLGGGRRTSHCPDVILFFSEMFKNVQLMCRNCGC